MSNGETQLDYFAIGLAVYPTSIAEYYEQQNAQQNQEFSYTMPEDPSQEVFSVDEGEYMDFDFNKQEEVEEL